MHRWTRQHDWNRNRLRVLLRIEHELPSGDQSPGIVASPPASWNVLDCFGREDYFLCRRFSIVHVLVHEPFDVELTEHEPLACTVETEPVLVFVNFAVRVFLLRLIDTSTVTSTNREFRIRVYSHWTCRMASTSSPVLYRFDWPLDS